MTKAERAEFDALKARVAILEQRINILPVVPLYPLIQPVIPAGSPWPYTVTCGKDIIS